MDFHRSGLEHEAVVPNQPVHVALERKSELKTAIRAVNTAVVSEDKEAASTALVTAGRKIDKAVTKGVLHKNNAANHKSAISKKVNAL